MTERQGTIVIGMLGVIAGSTFVIGVIVCAAFIATFL